MRKVIIFFAIFMSLKTYGQEAGYQPGFIVTQTNDTIVCLVPVETFFDDKISIKKNADGDEEIIALSKIRFLVTGTKKYENIAYQKNGKTNHKLMWLEIEGKLNLYLELIVNTGGLNAQSGGLEFYGPPTKTYVIRKGDSTFLIERKIFSETIIPLISDNKEMVGLVDTKIYTYKNLEDLITDYNNPTQ